MARTVKEMPKAKRGRPEVYPYSKLFNGKVWENVEGEDFNVSPASYKAAIYAAKTKRGFTVRTSTRVDEQTGKTIVTVQRLTGAVAARYNANRKAKVA